MKIAIWSGRKTNACILKNWPRELTFDLNRITTYFKVVLVGPWYQVALRKASGGVYSWVCSALAKQKRKISEDHLLWFRNMDNNLEQKTLSKSNGILRRSGWSIQMLHCELINCTTKVNNAPKEWIKNTSMDFHY